MENTWTDGNPHSPSCCRTEEDIEESGREKLSWAWEEGEGKNSFQFCLWFSASYSVLIGNKLLFPGQVSFACGSNRWQIYLSVFWPKRFFLIVSPVLWRRNSERAARWASGSQLWSAHHNQLILQKTINSSSPEIRFSRTARMDKPQVKEMACNRLV